jgi:hypothetical protein
VVLGDTLIDWLVELLFQRNELPSEAVNVTEPLAQIVDKVEEMVAENAFTGSVIVAVATAEQLLASVMVTL